MVIPLTDARHFLVAIIQFKGVTKIIKVHCNSIKSSYPADYFR